MSRTVERSHALLDTPATARHLHDRQQFLEESHTPAVLVQRSPAQLADDGDLGEVIGVLISDCFAAAVLLALRWQLARYVAHAPQIVAELRPGAPALDAAIARRGGPVLLPAATAGNAQLTPTEIPIVEGLASATAPKQLARDVGVVRATAPTSATPSARPGRAHCVSSPALRRRPNGRSWSACDEPARRPQRSGARGAR